MVSAACGRGFGAAESVKMNKFTSFIKGIIYGFGSSSGSLSGGTLLSVFGEYDFVCDLLSFRKIAEPESKRLYELTDTELLEQNKLREKNYEEYVELKKERKENLITFVIAAAVGAFGLYSAYSALTAGHPLPAAMFMSGFILGGTPLLLRTVFKEGKPFLHLLPYAVIPCAGVILMSAFFGAKTEPVTVTQTPKTGDSKVTVVTVKNDTGQTINDWVITFPEGRVDTASGTRLIYEKTFAESIAGLVRSPPEHENNAFTGNDANKTIPPGGSVSFTYGSRMGTRLPLGVKMSYKTDARVLITILFAAVLAGIAINTPGLSAGIVFSVFGVGATLSSSLQNLNISALIPCIIGIPFGIILAAKAGFALSQKHRKTLYAILFGLTIGGAFAVFPKQIEMKLDFFIGVGLFILAAAISAALGMERKSSEDYKSVMDNPLN
jgi:uncharacterized membrane protein